MVQSASVPGPMKEGEPLPSLLPMKGRLQVCLPQPFSFLTAPWYLHQNIFFFHLQFKVFAIPVIIYLPVCGDFDSSTSSLDPYNFILPFY